LGAGDHDDSCLPDEDAAKRLLYRLGPRDYAAAALIAFADSGAAPDDKGWREAATLGERWQAPVFPLKGTDVMTRCGVEGPALGALLKTLEAEWARAGFAASKGELLERAAELNRKSSKQDR
ncbi:MAG TPA: CCA tRNA nucleotidyltransferase, partial [Candidatus Binatia bacterium]|nr:CCA tRNA nucleotidyltransferase [Candidatus Binatia bacterium]